MVQKLKRGFDKDSWYIHGLTVQNHASGTDWTHGLDMDSWYRYGLMVQTKTHGIDNTHGIDLALESVLLNHTRTRGPSVIKVQCPNFLDF